MGSLTGKKSDNFNNTGGKRYSIFAPNIYDAWRISIIIIAAIPSLHFIFTFDSDGNISNINKIMRLFGFPIFMIETMVLLIAYRAGWKPLKYYLCLPVFTRNIILIWIACVFYTSIFASNSPVMSIFFVLRFYMHALLLAALIFLISSAKEFNFRCWMSRLTLGLYTYLILLIIFCVAVFGQKDFQWIERVPSATNIRQIGNVIGLLTIVPTVMLLFEPSQKKRLLTLASVTAAMAFIMWTGTRGAILGFIAAICVSGWIFRKSIPLGRFAVLACSLALALAVSAFVPTPSDAFGIIRMADSFSNSDPASGRIEMWRSTIDAIRSAPLLGYGSGTYRENMVLLNGYPFNHPHNFVLQFIYDWGIFGGSCALLLLSSLGWAIFRSKDAPANRRFVAISGFVGVVTIGLIEGTLFHPLPIVIGITLIAPALVYEKAASEPDQSNS
jgi:O-antigen ligase